jgi:hypothetical protein
MFGRAQCMTAAVFQICDILIQIRIWLRILLVVAVALKMSTKTEVFYACFLL